MVHTIQTVFLIAVPIAAVAFALSWLLPDIELRKTVRTADPGKELGMHESRIVARGDPARPGTPRSTREPP